MTEGRVAILVRDIIGLCAEDAVYTELAIANFELLIEAMTRYGRAPGLYDAMVEQTEADDCNGDCAKLLGVMERIVGKRLGMGELVKLAESVAASIGSPPSRQVKRSRPLLLSWFQERWAEAQPVIVMMREQFAGGGGER